MVTTSAGAQGFGIVAGVHALVADTPDDFAAAVVRVLDDPDFATRLGRNGRRLAEQVCTESVANRRMDELLEGIGCRSRPHRDFRSRLRSVMVHAATWAHDVAVRPWRAWLAGDREKRPVDV